MHFPLVGMDAQARRLPLESLLNSISGCIINARILGPAAAALTALHVFLFRIFHHFCPFKLSLPGSSLNQQNVL